MEDIHLAFTRFKIEFPDVFAKYEALGKEIHENSGPLPEKTRWLLKIVISASSGHRRALETHLAKGREAGLNDDEIAHALLLLIQTQGLPTFMSAYEVLRDLR